MTSWTDIEWIPVERQLPGSEDGTPVLDGTKVGVFVLTVDMVINGKNPEARGYHLDAAKFDDDESDGVHRVMFWAPCWELESLSGYATTQDNNEAPPQNSHPAGTA